MRGLYINQTSPISWPVGIVPPIGFKLIHFLLLTIKQSIYHGKDT